MNFREYIEDNFKYKLVSGGTEYQLNYCPFCQKEGNDVRIYVSVKNGLGFCHHCSTGFAPIKLVMANEEVNKQTAINILKGVEDSFYKEEEQEDEKDFPIIFPETVQITEGHIAYNYLKNRNVSMEMIKYFQLAYDYLRKRVFIPIFDVNGRMISWQGRDITGKAELKYLFPKGFKGAEYLYNIHNIKDKPKYLVITEGVFDVFGWYKAGVKNVVATFGKKISDIQLDYIYKKNPEVIFVGWDSDAHLEKYNLTERIKPFFKKVYIVDLDNKDADEVSSNFLTNKLLNAKQYRWEDKVQKLI